jgi:undecaprenyl-diphosphatase
VAVIPALVAGALLSSFVKSVLYETPAVYAATFIIGGVVMLVAERFRPAPVVRNAEHTPLSRAFGVGLCQMLAIVPGVSRSGADDRRRNADGPRPTRRCRVLVLPGNSDDGRRVRP